MINILENAQKVSVTENSCEDCQSAIVEVTFKVSDQHSLAFSNR